ncbi:MAG: type II toxin-antitoxin system RelE/ParE family toxin [Nitrosomonas sp.]|nr:type II toxin-antitoxin system RelE/ParE family toxin [Nitrosomonas sp.]
MITLVVAWTITLYNEKVEAETLALPPGILANFLRIAELIEEFGPDLGRPHTAPLGKGLFEIRAKGRRRHFGLYFVPSKTGKSSFC